MSTPLVIDQDRVFDSGAVAVAATWTLIGIIVVAGSAGRTSIEGLVGGTGPLTNLKITRALRRGGHQGADEVDYKKIAEDTDFATATNEMQNCVPPTPQSTVTGATFQILLNNDSVAEFAVWAKRTVACTLRIRGRIR